MQSQQDGESPRRGLATGVTALEKAAQGGHGFQTVGLDLGALGGRSNVDEESRRQSSSSGGVAGGSRSSSSSYEAEKTSGGQQASSSSHHSSQSGSHSKTYTDDEYEENDYEENDDSQSQQNQAQQHGSQSSWSRSSGYSHSHKTPLNVQHGSVDQMFKHYPRNRRDVPDVIQMPICKSTECEYVRCVVGPLEKNNGALIALRTRLVAHTLHKVK